MNTEELTKKIVNTILYQRHGFHHGLDISIVMKLWRILTPTITIP